MSHFFSQEELQDDPESMQEMDILEMNVLDETENDNGIPAEDETENFHLDEDAVMDEEHEDALLESEDEARGPEVGNWTLNFSTDFSVLSVLTGNFLMLLHLYLC